MVCVNIYRNVLLCTCVSHPLQYQPSDILFIIVVSFHFHGKFPPAWVSHMTVPNWRWHRSQHFKTADDCHCVAMTTTRLAETPCDHGQYATFEDDLNDSDETFTAEKAIECIGFGRFQVFVGLAAGLSWIADGMELMVISILGPVLVFEWGITVYEEALLSTAVFCGIAVGSPLLGWFSDKYGRRRGVLLASAWVTVAGVLSAMAPNFYWLIFLRFMVGMGIGGEPQSITYLAEFVSNQFRGPCLLSMAIFFATGGSLAVLLAVAILVPYGWRWWLGACAVPSFVFVVFCLVFGSWLEWLPRSPRYDLLTGNTDNTIRTLQMAARWNKTKLPEGKLVPEPEIPRGRILDLLRPGYKLISFYLVILWFSVAFCYYGIALLTTHMVAIGNTCNPHAFVNTNNATSHNLDLIDFWDLFWTSTSEIPGVVLAAILVEVIGRKRNIIITGMMYTVTCLSLLICMQKTPMVALLFLARACIASPFQTLFLYTSEVYPTEVRALSLGLCSMICRLGGMATPNVANILLSYSIHYAIGVYAGVGFLLTFVAVFLPLETKGMSLKSHGW